MFPVIGVLVSSFLKTDANGNEQWSKIWGGGSNDGGHSAKQTTDGGYILLGETDSTAPGINLQAYLLKTDADGNEMWSKTFGSVSKFDSGSSVWQTIDGGYIFSGYTGPPGGGYDDVYLVKTDANGNEMWSKVFGGSDSDIGFSVQ